MTKNSLTNEQVLTMLAAAPQRIAALTTGLTPAQLQAAPAPDSWSINEVLAHLRACADMWGGCIAQIIANDHPTLRAVNPRTWIDNTDYLEQAFQTSLDAFATQRTDLLAVLEPLTPDGWARSATVTGAGKPLERTVRSYTEWMAVHERSHFRPIERITRALRMDQ